MTFPRTKIQPPQPRPGALMASPALEQRLGAALLARRLVLLCAAAGFGKTSALARQVAALPAGTALAWVACDEGDSPTQLLECLLAALEPYDPPWRTAPEALVRSAAEAVKPAQRRQIAAELINALDACEVAHGVVVLDDLHRVAHPVLFEFLDHVLERLTPRWTFVISTRQEPPLALARLRMQDEIDEFRIEALRFARDEALALGAAAGLAPEAALRLYERSQGWPAGLRLALNALRGAAPGASMVAASASAAAASAIDRHAIDYLAAEVIARLTPPLRDFLLCCSVLPELSASRCAALTGDAQAGARLEEIERAGLFVTALGDVGGSGSEPTLRLHDLFRDALQARLAREQPERLPGLYRRAAATEADELRRLAWLQRAGAWEEAEQCLGECTESLVAGGQGAALREVIERFPPALRERSMAVQMARAMLGWVRWDWEAAIDATARAAAVGAGRGDAAAERSARSYHAIALAGASRAEAQAMIATLLADPALDGPALCRTLVAACWMELRGGSQRQIALHWGRMMDTLEGITSLPRWFECSPLPPFVGLPGMRAPLQRYVDGALRLLPDHPTPLRGMCHAVQGWLQLWAGEVERAEACAEAATSDARWLALPVNVDSYTRSLQAVLLAVRGRHAESLATAQGLVADVQASSEPLRVRVYLGLYLFLEMRCAALLGDDAALVAAARRLARDAGHGQGWLSRYQTASADAYLAAAAGDLDEACGRWRALLASEDRSDIYGQVAETRLRLADALWRRGRPAGEAAAVLGPLFASIDEAGEWGAVLMAGPALLHRLAASDWGGALPAARQAQLASWAQRASDWAGGWAGHGSVAPVLQTTPAAADDGTTAAAALSAREQEVLARIAAGDSNKLIARAFDLSPHTVKRHVANILDKLDLRSRGQAAAWYRQHG
jgi:LuxR family maltose regulon positive regulatory protein